MILDKIENANLYSAIGELIAKGLEYIKSTDLKALASGKYEIGDGLTAIVSEYETNHEADGKLEAHKKYIDIQYIISGEELIGYTALNNQTPSVDYNETRDVVFFKETGLSFSKLNEGMFAVYFPTDLHMPGICDVNSTKVKKLVIKILI